MPPLTVLDEKERRETCIHPAPHKKQKKKEGKKQTKRGKDALTLLITKNKKEGRKKRKRMPVPTAPQKKQIRKQGKKERKKEKARANERPGMALAHALPKTKRKKK